MAITIPQKLRKHLKDDNCKWERCIGTLIEKLEPILDQTPEFFPQYTNHGLKHVETVLKMTAELIPSKSLGKNALSSRDIACLIAAILIHDLGMFLKPDGLTMLMAPEWDQHRLSDLDKSSWSDAWDQYITSTKRLPVSQKIRCFGKDLTTEHITLDKDKMVYDDKLVIGEFLRRHHPRLAYEIAVAGLPGSTPQKFLENSGFNEIDCSIIGLMARSHGMPLREVEDYLGSNAHHSNLPVYYLMSVLRLADYLDASESRAPMVRLKQEGLTSPLSQEEWALNQCFKIDSSRWYSDTKNYSIAATPNSSSEFARLEKWLKDVQSELDQCWAILAEKYPNSKLRLSIHRIKCTMYEGLNYKTLSGNILPREVKVTANPEIVKLMMEPLYGDDPTYGVRELLQNAVDACLEREQWEKTHKDGDPNYKGLVDIRIENDVFTITDNGMGMNEDVLLNYYLSAGSSYRSSDAWMAANAPDGKSQVARTGKFGVGFLAAFLLGDEVEVHTQHCADTKGYHFTFGQESAPLDVERLKRSEPGTTITIKLKATAIEKWDNDPEWYNWYAFDDPVVSYTIDGKPVEHENLCLHRPPAGNDGWLELPSDDFEAYHWKPHLTSEQPEFYCNGIRIYHRFPDSMVGYRPQIYYPHISILDKQGKLAVDLARKKLEEIPMRQALLQEVLRWHIARLLLTPWNSEEDHRQNLILGFTLRANETYGHLPFLLAPGGFQLNHASLLSPLSIRDYVVLYHEGPDARDARLSSRNFLLDDKPCTIVAADVYKQWLSDDYAMWKLYYDTPSAFINDLLKENTGLLNSVSIDYTVYRHTRSVWFRPDVPDEMYKYIQSEITLDEPSTEAYLLTGCWQGRKSNMPIDPERFPAEQFPAAFHVVPDLHDYHFFNPYDPLFVEMIQELLIPEPGWPQNIWIPFDMAEREQKFKKAFKELKPYMDHIQKYPIE